MTDTLAIWNVNETAKLGREANLRNVCRQIEDEYVTWGRFVSQVCRIQWPAIGELGRYSVDGVIVSFTKHRRYVQVKDADNHVIGTVTVHPGMASELYAMAGTVVDRCEADTISHKPLTDGQAPEFQTVNEMGRK